jgi:hypothetical protein
MCAQGQLKDTNISTTKQGEALPETALYSITLRSDMRRKFSEQQKEPRKSYVLSIQGWTIQTWKSTYLMK